MISVESLLEKKDDTKISQGKSTKRNSKEVTSNQPTVHKKQKIIETIMASIWEEHDIKMQKQVENMTPAQRLQMANNSNSAQPNVPERQIYGMKKTEPETLSDIRKKLKQMRTPPPSFEVPFASQPSQSQSMMPANMIVSGDVQNQILHNAMGTVTVNKPIVQEQPPIEKEMSTTSVVPTCAIDEPISLVTNNQHEIAIIQSTVHVSSLTKHKEETILDLSQTSTKVATSTNNIDAPIDYTTTKSNDVQQTDRCQYEPLNLKTQHIDTPVNNDQPLDLAASGVSRDKTLAQQDKPIIGAPPQAHSNKNTLNGISAKPQPAHVKWQNPSQSTALRTEISHAYKTTSLHVSNAMNHQRGSHEIKNISSESTVRHGQHGVNLSCAAVGLTNEQSTPKQYSQNSSICHQLQASSNSSAVHRRSISREVIIEKHSQIIKNPLCHAHCLPGKHDPCCNAKESLSVANSKEHVILQSPQGPSRSASSQPTVCTPNSQPHQMQQYTPIDSHQQQTMMQQSQQDLVASQLRPLSLAPHVQSQCQSSHTQHTSTLPKPKQHPQYHAQQLGHPSNEDTRSTSNYNHTPSGGSSELRREPIKQQHTPHMPPKIQNSATGSFRQHLHQSFLEQSDPNQYYSNQHHPQRQMEYQQQAVPPQHPTTFKQNPYLQQQPTMPSCNIYPPQPHASSPAHVRKPLQQAHVAPRPNLRTLLQQPSTSQHFHMPQRPQQQHSALYQQMTSQPQLPFTSSYGEINVPPQQPLTSTNAMNTQQPGTLTNAHMDTQEARRINAQMNTQQPLMPNIAHKSTHHPSISTNAQMNIPPQLPITSTNAQMLAPLQNHLTAPNAQIRAPAPPYAHKHGPPHNPLTLTNKLMCGPPQQPDGRIEVPSQQSLQLPIGRIPIASQQPSSTYEQLSSAPKHHMETQLPGQVFTSPQHSLVPSQPDTTTSTSPIMLEISLTQEQLGSLSSGQRSSIAKQEPVSLTKQELKALGISTNQQQPQLTSVQMRQPSHGSSNKISQHYSMHSSQTHEQQPLCQSQTGQQQPMTQSQINKQYPIGSVPQQHMNPSDLTQRQIVTQGQPIEQQPAALPLVGQQQTMDTAQISPKPVRSPQNSQQQQVNDSPIGENHPKSHTDIGQQQPLSQARIAPMHPINQSHISQGQPVSQFIGQQQSQIVKPLQEPSPQTQQTVQQQITASSNPTDQPSKSHHPDIHEKTNINKVPVQKCKPQDGSKVSLNNSMFNEDISLGDVPAFLYNFLHNSQSDKAINKIDVANAYRQYIASHPVLP